MEYTNIDPDFEKDTLLAEKASEALWVAYTIELDAKALQFCADIAVVTEKGDDGNSAAAQAKVLLERSHESTALSASIAKRIKGKSMRASVDRTLKGRRSEWLPLYIKEMERGHAQHSVLAEIADEEDDIETGDQHRLAMLRYEGAHWAASG